jgi:two-component system CheB/CheR fusion protein
MQTSEPFEGLLEYLRSARGFDFTGYKRASLARRIDKRMADVGVESYDAYRDHLEVHQSEFNDLFNYILINVTTFFRDPPVWEYLAREIVPRIVKDRPDGQIRLWSAGCASGEEAYSLAIVFADILGDEAFRERVKIYGTDADNDAITHARQGLYQAKALENVSEDQRARFFEAVESRFTFRRDLRRALIFGRHDLVQDAPISRTDLICCRNTLMYLNAETQSGVLDKFRFSLAENGFLVLGKSEMLFTRVRSFTSVDLKWRVFAKHRSQEDRERLRYWGDDTEMRSDPPALSSSAFDEAPLAQLLVSREGRVLLINRYARRLFGLGQDDVGRPLQDLEISYRPTELRGPIEESLSSRRPTQVSGVAFTGHDGVSRTLNIELTPLHADGVGGIVVSFLDISEADRLQRDLETSNEELETAMEELQSTNEELETTNEELQSTNEELETTNEELQSTNEELETMNEELQSTNEELQAVNEELHLRTNELASTNTFMTSILSSVQAGVMVIDAELRVHVWNRTSEDLWGLREDEAIGQRLFDLDIGLPLEPVRDQLRRLLAGEVAIGDPVEVEGVNRRGRRVRCRISCSKIDDPGMAGIVVLVEAEEISGDS